MAKIRLDALMVSRGMAESREKAKSWIMSGVVFVDGRRCDKSGTQVSADSRVELRGGAPEFVSRGGKKLEKALFEFEVSPAGKKCIDCGASTGGFTHCLLKHGAARVYAIDVGYGQLDWSLRRDSRVVTMERTNARYLKKEDIPEPIDLAVIDVSFISLKLIFPAVRRVLKTDGQAICLIKPQFEAGRESVGKKGVVKDPLIQRAVLDRFLQDADESGFAVQALSFSPIKGPEGNIEFLGYLLADGTGKPQDTEAVVEAAHSTL